MRAAPIRFGTSGWRGVLGDEFTFERARAVVRAIAEWGRGRGRGFVVTHDTRFLAERFAEDAAAVLAAAGLRAWRGAGPLPTPAAAHEVRRRRAAGGIVFTASHNPPEYQGLKLLVADGASAPPGVTREIESLAQRVLARGNVPRAAAVARAVELGAPYRRELGALLETRLVRGARLAVVYDALHGTGAGFLDRVLADAGLDVRARRLERDPGFGGAAPDPKPERLRGIALELRRLRGARLGLATDGDADRIAALDEHGRVLSSADALALLVEHAARSGRARRGVALTWAAGSLAGRVARAHGLAVERHPVGFTHLSRALAAGRADLAGDESGGFALAAFGPDKDGILAGALLTECAAANGGSLAAALGALRRKHGACAWGQLAVRLDAGSRATLAALRAGPPARVAGARVVRVRAVDGVRLELEDGFVMLRVSGTEPLARVYAEAPTRAELARRLRAGAKLAAGARSGSAKLAAGARSGSAKLAAGARSGSGLFRRARAPGS
jgi:phosphomannomutase